MFSKNIKETEKLAKKFLKEISLNKDKNKDKRTGALVVCLSGDLGAGKTAFTKAFARHIGIKEKVSSPTFVLIKKYLLKHPKFNFLFHIDAYRFKDEDELLRLGWEEIIGDEKHLVFIEWPENVSKIIPKGSKFIYIKSDEKGERIFEFK